MSRPLLAEWNEITYQTPSKPYDCCYQASITLVDAATKGEKTEMPRLISGLGIQVTSSFPSWSSALLGFWSGIICRSRAAILNLRSRCGAGPRIVRDHLHRGPLA
jgi:hypothetical protein